MIRVIEIENIKGIQHKKFDLNIYPNKPSLLVAPNGFGKSSIATAFNSMNSRRIKLEEDNFYKENNANLPKVVIEYEKPSGEIIILQATHDYNSISGVFDYFVINNQLKPKGIGSMYGRATAILMIQDIVLIERIPENINFGYSYTSLKRKFGENGKVLPNANVVLNNKKLVEKLSANYQALQRANGKRIQSEIQGVINQINSKNGTAEKILNWINDNLLNNLKRINYLNTIGNIINEFDIGLNSETKSFLLAIQLIWLYNENPNKFKSACNYSNYKLDKERFDATLKTFNSTWKDIRSTETQGKLLVKFPKATQISNGQRDILTFISMLFKAKRNLNKNANILIIDEVFDYLDDANLIAAQYYVTEFIKGQKELGRRIYPLIMTHLNPYYFKNFAFNKQKVYYLNKSTVDVSSGIKTLLRNRKDERIKDDVSKYLLHYHPESIDKRAVFREIGIPELWGEGSNFIRFANREVEKYLNNEPFDPFAVCAALRIKIEKIAYNKLQSDEAKFEFLITKKTRNKLEKAEEKGVISPESHYLLGIIYNEGMHWKENQDNVSPIVTKLENLTIKKLIADVFK